ncbi:hypothetical protein [Sphingobium baderi]|nr:hypothetical protein [Sphingobium baderi]
MRKSLRTAALAGVAALAVAGTALAAGNDSRVMTVDLPDGSLARIEYKGDVAPRVVVEPGTRFMPVAFADPSMIAPFALFDRIAADMDRQSAAMLRQVQALQAGLRDHGGQLDFAKFGNLPAGTVSYRFVSIGDGSRVCSHSWRLTSQGPDQQPKLISASSGDCAADGKMSTPVAGGSGSARTMLINHAVVTPPPAAPSTI